MKAAAKKAANDGLLFDWGTPPPPWLLDPQTRLPMPPLHDLEPHAGAMCAPCSLTPIDRRCDNCPRVSTRLYRELLAEAPKPRFRLFRRKRKD